MKKAVAALAASLSLLSPLLCLGKEIQVGPEAQFKSVQEAVDALPKELDEPFVISVSPGVYREQVKISGVQTSSVNTLTLRGTPGKTVIDAEGERDFCVWLHKQKYVSIEGVTAVNANGYGCIFIEQSSNCSVIRCVAAFSKSFDGICVSDESCGARVEHCALYGNKRAGAYLNNSSKEAVMRFNAFSSNGAAIELNSKYPSLPVFAEWNAFQPGKGGFEGESGIDADPEFASPESLDFRLKGSSPCPRWGVYGQATEASPDPKASNASAKDGAFFKVDLKPWANVSLKDEKPSDGKGGWTDQGDWDLRHLPSGETELEGVPFSLPASPEEKAVVILKGEWTKPYPESALSIKVGEMAESLFFLHASAWTAGSLVMSYAVHYADGKTLELPISNHAQVGDWFMPKSLDDAKVAWSGKHPLHPSVEMGLYLYKWKNPMPFTKISSIDIVSAGAATPIVVAVSGKRPAEDMDGRLSLSADKGDGKAVFKLDYSSGKDCELEASVAVFDEAGKRLATLGPKPLKAKASSFSSISFEWTPPREEFSCNYMASAYLSSGERAVAEASVFIPVQGSAAIAAQDSAKPAEMNFDPSKPAGEGNLIYSCEIQPWQNIHYAKFDKGAKPPLIDPSVFDRLKAAGGTVAHIILWWSYLEPDPWKYDFSSLEYALENCRRTGLKAMVSVWMGDHGVPKFCRHENMLDQDGKPFLGDRGSNSGTGWHPSIWGTDSRAHFGALIRELCGRYVDDRDVVAWGFMYQHVEVVIHDRVGKKPHLYDYSPWAQDAYRRYLRDERGYSLESLNARYGSSSKSWDEVVQPAPTPGIDVSARWSDFQDFRVRSARESFSFVFENVRKIDPAGKKALFTFNPCFSLDLCAKYNAIPDLTSSEGTLHFDSILAKRLYFDGPMIVEPCAIPPDVYEIGAGFFNALSAPTQGYLWIGTAGRGFPASSPASKLFSKLRQTWSELAASKRADADMAVLVSEDTVHAEDKVFNLSKRYCETGSNYDHLTRRLVFNQYNYDPVQDGLLASSGFRFKRQYKLILDTESKVMRRGEIASLLEQLSNGAVLVLQPESGRYCRENPAPEESLAFKLGWKAAAAEDWKPSSPSPFAANVSDGRLFGIGRIGFERGFPLEKLGGEAILSDDGTPLAVIKTYGKGKAIMLAGEISWEPARATEALSKIADMAGVEKPVSAAPMVRASLMRKGGTAYVLAFNESSSKYVPLKLKVPSLENGLSSVRCVTDGGARLGAFDNREWRDGFPITLAPHEFRVYAIERQRD